MDAAGQIPFLSEIQAQVEQYQARAAQFGQQRAAWRAQSGYMQAAQPGVQVQAGGDFCSLGELSPGCRACRAGHWDCLFLTHLCNLACPFCYSPLQTDLPPGSTFGTEPAEITAAYRGMPIDGVSFSGGEPFLNPTRLLEWAAHFTRELPGVYIWLYTNGLLVEEAHLAQLGQLGVAEIRFDAAATGYNHPATLQKMAAAARWLPAVTVEIPAIPEQASRLLAALPAWAEAGVRYLNLHELIFEPGSLSENLPGPRQAVLLPDGHRTAIHPHSRGLTQQVMGEVQRLNLPLNVNDCSTAGKVLQVEGRRRLLADRLRASYEKVTSNGLLETLTVCEQDQLFLIHPDGQSAAAVAFPTARVYRLARLGPLSAQEAPIWVRCEAQPWGEVGLAG